MQKKNENKQRKNEEPIYFLINNQSKQIEIFKQTRTIEIRIKRFVRRCIFETEISSFFGR
jgi:hypothetical protein